MWIPYDEGLPIEEEALAQMWDLSQALDNMAQGVLSGVVYVSMQFLYLQISTSDKVLIPMVTHFPGN